MGQRTVRSEFSRCTPCAASVLGRMLHTGEAAQFLVETCCSRLQWLCSHARRPRYWAAEALRKWRSSLCTCRFDKWQKNWGVLSVTPHFSTILTRLPRLAVGAMPPRAILRRSMLEVGDQNMSSWSSVLAADGTMFPN